MASTGQVDSAASAALDSFPVVAIATSAGGLAALSQVLSALPASFAAAIVVVQHLAPTHRSLLPEILSRRTCLAVKQAQEGDRLRPGALFIAPPDRHVLVNQDGTLSLTHTKLIHFVRPSADLLFESVAASCDGRAIAVVLTGAGCDGAMGIRAIKKRGGRVIVQSVLSAEFAGMPTAAIQTGDVDFILAVEEIAPTLVQLTTEGHGS